MSKGKFCDNCNSSLSGFVFDELINKFRGYTIIGPLFESNKHFCDIDCLKEYYSNFDAEEKCKQNDDNESPCGNEGDGSDI